MVPKAILSKKVKRISDRLSIVSAKLKLKDGQTVEWIYPDVADGVAAIPIDKDNNVYLTREWRLPWNREVLQIPAGKCTDEDENKRINQVHNELREEIGLDAKDVEKLISCYASAGINFTGHIYLARDLFHFPKAPDADEYTEVIKMPFKEAYGLFTSGKEPTTSYTLIAFLMAKEKLFS